MVLVRLPVSWPRVSEPKLYLLSASVWLATAVARSSEVAVPINCAAAAIAAASAACVSSPRIR